MSGGCARTAARVLAAAGLLVGPAALVVSSVTPAAAADSDGGAFRTAWGTMGTTQIDLTSDVSLDCTDPGGDGVADRDSPTPIVVNGHGHAITQTCRTGSNNGVLASFGSGSVTLLNITVTGGQTANAGAGVLVPGATLTIDHSTIANNESFCGQGAGVHSAGSGDLTIRSSTLTGNIADQNEGGAADHDGAGTLRVINSTVTNNKQLDDGALAQDSGTLALVYATVVANTKDTTLTSPISCAGSVNAPHKVHTQSSVDVANVAPFNNFSSFGSVVAKPMGVGTSGSPAVVNCGFFNTTPVPSQGYNFSDDTSCAFTGTGDSQSTTNNPLLGGLANNGGATQTMLPQTGSPLINAIPGAACQSDGASGITTDQRDLPRPDAVSGLCDIGAVEVQPVVVSARFTG